MENHDRNDCGQRTEKFSPSEHNHFQHNNVLHSNDTFKDLQKSCFNNAQRQVDCSLPAIELFDFGVHKHGDHANTGHHHKHHHGKHADSGAFAPAPERVNTAPAVIPLVEVVSRTEVPTDRSALPGSSPEVRLDHVPGQVVGAEKMPTGAIHQGLSRLADNPSNLTTRELLNLKAQGISGFNNLYELPNNRLLNQAELDFIDRDYAAARAAGMPMITRFSYTQVPGGQDASADLIKAQLAQISPVLHKNEDAIGAIELGFVGAWGEWNRSTHGNDNNNALAKDIYDSFTKALPDTPIAFRYVKAVRAIFGENPPDNVILHNDSVGRVDGNSWSKKDAGSYTNDADYQYIVNHKIMTIGENQEEGDPAEVLKRIRETNITSLHLWGNVAKQIKEQGLYDDIIQAMNDNARTDGIPVPS